MKPFEVALMCAMIAFAFAALAADPVSVNTDGVVTDAVGQSIGGATVELVCAAQPGLTNHSREIQVIS